MDRLTTTKGYGDFEKQDTSLGLGLIRDQEISDLIKALYVGRVCWPHAVGSFYDRITILCTEVQNHVVSGVEYPDPFFALVRRR